MPDDSTVTVDPITVTSDGLAVFNRGRAAGRRLRGDCTMAPAKRAWPVSWVRSSLRGWVRPFPDPQQSQHVHGGASGAQRGGRWPAGGRPPYRADQRRGPHDLVVWSHAPGKRAARRPRDRCGVRPRSRRCERAQSAKPGRATPWRSVSAASGETGSSGQFAARQRLAACPLWKGRPCWLCGLKVSFEHRSQGPLVAHFATYAR